MIFLIALFTFASTFLGGVLALKFKDKLHLILGFSAGAVLGVAFFDLLPEAIELGEKYFSVGKIVHIVALGFLIYFLLDRAVSLYFREENDGHGHKNRGILGAGSFSLHSFLDGVAIGVAFQVSVTVGAIVAVAVLVHDFSDGINTVNISLKNGLSRKSALKWLLMDAVAPVAGVLSTMFFSIHEKSLSIILALFAGFFLYIAASDLIPESHHSHPKFLTTMMTVLGMVVLYMAVRFAT